MNTILALEVLGRPDQQLSEKRKQRVWGGTAGRQWGDVGTTEAELDDLVKQPMMVSSFYHLYTWAEKSQKGMVMIVGIRESFKALV